MKIVLLSLTYLAGAGELFLAIYFWLTNQKNEIRRVMSLMSLVVSVWAFSNALSAYTNPSPVVSFFIATTFVAGILLVTLIFHFSIIFPHKIFYFDRFHALLLYIPVVLFAYIEIFSKAIVAGYTVAPDNPGYVSIGPLFGLYNVCLTVFFLASLGILFYKYIRSDGINKENLRIVFWSIFIGGAPAISFNLWAVFFAVQINPLIAVDFTLFWVLLTTYIIFRK